jgi:hypothetical protein
MAAIVATTTTTSDYIRVRMARDGAARVVGAGLKTDTTVTPLGQI